MEKVELLEFRVHDERPSGMGVNRGDCVVRAAAVVLGVVLGGEYDEVYHDLWDRAVVVNGGRRGRRRVRGVEGTGGTGRGALSPRLGVPRDVYEPYFGERGLVWTPLMRVGTGTTVHLRRERWPGSGDGVPGVGAFVVRVSRHLTAVIDGCIYDLVDPSRDGTRAVYGWYELSVGGVGTAHKVVED